MILQRKKVYEITAERNKNSINVYNRKKVTV